MLERKCLGQHFQDLGRSFSIFHTELLPQMWHEITNRLVIVSFLPLFEMFVHILYNDDPVGDRTCIRCMFRIIMFSVAFCDNITPSSTFIRLCIKYAGTFQTKAIIRCGILGQIFATGAAKVHHYKIWRQTKQLPERSLHSRYQFLLISTEKADFYGES